MKKIAILNQDSGYLMIDLANTFCEAGYDVELITGRLAQRTKPLSDDIKLKKIIQYNRSNSFNRITTWIVGALQMIFLVIFKLHDYHLFIVSNPPFAPLIPLVLKNSYSILIFDIYPDALTEAGMISKKNIFANIWKKANIRAFSKADRVFTITDGMKQLLCQYTDKKRIVVVPIWSDNSLKPIAPNENEFIKRHNLEGKFIILYSGNLGLLNEVDILIDIVSKIPNTKVFLIIIGRGPKYLQIEKKATKLKLNNFLLMPWQAASELPHTFAAANLAVISLGKSASRIGIPSKIYNFMSVGAPILGLASPDSDLDSLVNQYQIGKCFTPNMQNEIQQYIEYLVENDNICKRLSKNALCASLKFTEKNASKFLE